MKYSSKGNLMLYSQALLPNVRFLFPQLGIYKEHQLH